MVSTGTHESGEEFSEVLSKGYLPWKLPCSPTSGSGRGMSCSVLPVCQCHMNAYEDKHDPETKIVTQVTFLTAG